MLVRGWETEHLCTVGGNANGTASVNNSMLVPQKIKSRIVIWFSNSTPGYISKNIESKISKRYLYSIIHNRLKHGSNLSVSIDRWMNKQNVVYTYDGVLFSLKKGQTYGYQVGKEGRDKLGDRDWHIHITVYKIDN